jgi:hypothetical protein
MEFGFFDTVFLITLIIFFLYRDLKRRFHSKENEIDKVLAEAEQVKYRNMVKEVMFCKSEIVEGQIFVYEKDTNTFITQQPDVESMFKYFINNYPNKRIQFGE